MEAPFQESPDHLEGPVGTAYSAVFTATADRFGPNSDRVEAFLFGLRNLGATQWRQVRDAGSPGETWARAFLEPPEDVAHAAAAALRYASLAAALTAVWVAARRAGIETALLRAGEAAREAASALVMGDAAAAKTAVWALVCEGRVASDKLRFLYAPFEAVMPLASLARSAPPVADRGARQLTLLAEPEAGVPIRGDF